MSELSTLKGFVSPRTAGVTALSRCADLYSVGVSFLGAVISVLLAFLHLCASPIF